MKSTAAGLPKCVRFSEKQTHHFITTRIKSLRAADALNYAMVNVPKLDEKLPIVEVSPFRKKVWKRGKSYAEDGERSRSVADVPSKGPEDFNFSDTGYPDPSRVTPRATPCPRALTGYGERRRKNRSAKGSQEPKNFVSSSNGFATLGTRQKTTLDDISSGENLNTFFSLLPRTRNEADGSRDHTIRVHGQRLEDVCPKPRVFSLEPWRHDVTHRTAATAPADGVTSSDLMQRMDHVSNVYRDEVIYDAFERSHTLPSIRIAKTALKKKRRRLDSRIPSGRKSGLGPHIHHSGVQNTLDVMSQSGRPLGLEKQLTLELKCSLQNLRRGRVRGLPERILPSRTTPRLDRSSTIGETMLHIGKSSNSHFAAKQNANKNTRAMSRDSSEDRLFSRVDQARTLPDKVNDGQEPHSVNRQLSSRLRRVSVVEPADSVLAEEELTEDNTYFHSNDSKNGSFKDFEKFEGSALLEKMIDKVQETNKMVLSPLDAEDLVIDQSPDHDSGNDPDMIPIGSDEKAKGLRMSITVGSEGDKDSGLDNECETVKSENDAISHGESMEMPPGMDENTNGSSDTQEGTHLTTDDSAQRCHNDSNKSREDDLAIASDVEITESANVESSESINSTSNQENLQNISESQDIQSDEDQQFSTDFQSEQDNGNNINHFKNGEMDPNKVQGIPKTSSTDSISSVDDTGHPLVNAS